MIISRTPVRISFFGGGTDLEEFYSKSYGAVLSSAIKKYIYVAINKKFDDDIRASYHENEIVDSLEKLKHPIIKACLKHVGITKKIEIVTIADISGRGTGLGSSSTLTVGLLNGLNSYLHKHKDQMELAEDACKIEIEILKKPIGKQDQYIAALGGFRYIKFYQDGRVTSELVNASDKTLSELQSNLVSFNVLPTQESERDGNAILADQRKNTNKKIEILEEMRDQAESGKVYLRKGDLSSFGKLLDRAWKLKRLLSQKISTDVIDNYYKKGIESGALGGKLSGAGGSGFLTFYCEKEKQKKLREAMSGLKEMEIKLEPEGTKIIAYDSVD
jgi:D-glycero-alpha-D-manno-heptose-7-phosphate kinase